MSSEYLAVPLFDGGGEKKTDEEDHMMLIKEPLSMCRLIAINFFAFSYSLILSTMGLLTLPVEVKRMYPENKGPMLGVMLGVAGISQLVCPLVGYFSDRCTSRMGRRIPFILSGSVFVLAGDLGMWWARRAPHPTIFMFALLVALLGINVVYSAFTALNADFVGKSQLGIASGIMAILQLLGSCTGFALLTFVIEVKTAYLAYAVSLVVGVAVTYFGIKHLDRPQNSNGEISLVTCKDIARCYTITPESHGDFFWVFVIRLLYYLATSIQAFLLYYLNDGIGVENPEETLTILVLVTQMVGAVVTVPVGSLSDGYGRKSILFFTCMFVAVTYLAFMTFPPITYVFIIAGCFGAANSALMTIEYALACDTLPNEQNFARDLGLWGVAAFLGGTIGPLITGPVLHVVGYQEGTTGYSKKGYIALFAMGVVFMVTSGFMVRMVKGSS